MSKNIGRRGFLVGLASSVIGGAVFTHWALFRRFTGTGFAEYLRLKFHYLNLEVTEAEFESFFQLYKRHYGWQRRWKPSALDPMPMTFLMSTDFFLNGADESQPVRFRQFYHPYVSPCWSPLIKAPQSRPVGGDKGPSANAGCACPVVSDLS
jgi:hypothetical protein